MVLLALRLYRRLRLLLALHLLLTLLALLALHPLLALLALQASELLAGRNRVRVLGYALHGARGQEAGR